MGATNKLAATVTGMNGMYPAQQSGRPMQALAGQNAPQPNSTTFNGTTDGINQAIAGGGTGSTDPAPFHNSITDFMNAHNQLAGGFAGMMKNMAAPPSGATDLGGSTPQSAPTATSSPTSNMSGINPNNLQSLFNQANTSNISPGATASGGPTPNAMLGAVSGSDTAPASPSPTSSLFSQMANAPISADPSTPQTLSAALAGATPQTQNITAPGAAAQNSQFQAAAPQPAGSQTPAIQQLSNSTLNGSISSVNTNPTDINGIRQQLINTLANNQQGIQAQPGAAPATAQLNPTGMVNAQQNNIYSPSNLAQYGITSPMQTVNPQAVSDAGTQMQSLDSLGGANSAFYNNMVNQFQPSFTAQRNTDLASAKEAAGNLTGSGFANALGTTVNRSLGAEQAQLATIGEQGIGDQMTQDQTAAQLANSRNIASASNNLTGQMANQNTQANLLQQLLNQGQGNANTALSAAQGNQNTTYNTNNQNAQLQQQNALQQYTTQTGVNQQNANNLTNLTGQIANNGVGPSQIVQQNGLGSLAGPAGSLIGQLLSGVGTPSGSPLTNMAGAAGSSLSSLLQSLMGGGSGDSGYTPDAATQAILNQIGGVGNLPGVQQIGSNSLTGGSGGSSNGGWSAALGGAGKGAGIGASIGSIIPGIGNIVGGGIGGVLGGIGSFFGL